MPALLEMALEGTYFRDGRHHHVEPYINTLQLPIPVTLDSGSMERHMVPHDAPCHQFRVMRYSNNEDSFVSCAKVHTMGKILQMEPGATFLYKGKPIWIQGANVLARCPGDDNGVDRLELLVINSRSSEECMLLSPLIPEEAKRFYWNEEERLVLEQADLQYLEDTPVITSEKWIKVYKLTPNDDWVLADSGLRGTAPQEMFEYKMEFRDLHGSIAPEQLPSGFFTKHDSMQQTKELLKRLLKQYSRDIGKEKARPKYSTTIGNADVLRAHYILGASIAKYPLPCMN